jgi:hypothetical protein
MISRSNIGRHLRHFSCAIPVYADDILLLAQSVVSLQYLVDLCSAELITLEMEINFKEIVCIRIGLRFDKVCARITVYGDRLSNWVPQCRYLGVDIVSASMFKRDLSNRKMSFYRAFNSVFGRISRYASVEVVIELVKKKCLHVLLYASEVLFLTASNFKMLDYVNNSVIRKIFNTKSNDVTSYCREVFGIDPVKDGRRASSIGLQLLIFTSLLYCNNFSHGC